MSEIDFIDHSIGDMICQVCGKIISRKDIQMNSSIHEKCKKQLQQSNKTFEKNIPNIDSIWSSRQFNSDETDDFMSVHGGKED